MSSPRFRGCRAAGAVIAFALGLSGCSRQTIGLGPEPDASLPTPTSTSSEPMKPPAQTHMEASVPRTEPTVSSSSSAPPAPDPRRYPRIWVHEPPDAQVRPPKNDHPTTEPDAGFVCRSREDCKDPEAPNCRPDTGKCVRCLFDSQCPAPFKCVPSTNECGCTSATDCRLIGACDPLTHQCLIGCSSMAPLCVQWAPFCDMGRGVCLQCVEDADCKGKTVLGATTELCKNGLCVQCREEADCADRRHCNVRDAVCVECLRSEHCGPGMQCFDQRCYPAPPGP